MNKPWSWKVTQGEKLSEEQPQCESESRLETKLAALPHHFTKKNGKQQRTDTSYNTLWPTLQNDSNFTQHPQWRRNMCFLMCPSMTWNTVPLGDAHSHKIQLTAPPSQHLIEQTRTITGRHSVALALPHWEVCTERRTKDNLVTSLCDEGVRDELITNVSSDATHWPTNKPKEPEARIENMTLRHGFWSRPLREQPPCKNLSFPTASTLDLADYSTQKFKHTHERIICILQISHDPSSLEKNVVKICRNETRQKAICPTHCPNAIRRIALQSQHADGLALVNKM